MAKEEGKYCTSSTKAIFGRAVWSCGWDESWDDLDNAVLCDLSALGHQNSILSLI